MSVNVSRSRHCGTSSSDKINKLYGVTHSLDRSEGDRSDRGLRPRITLLLDLYYYSDHARSPITECLRVLHLICRLMCFIQSMATFTMSGSTTWIFIDITNIGAVASRFGIDRLRSGGIVRVLVSLSTIGSGLWAQAFRSLMRTRIALCLWMGRRCSTNEIRMW